MTAELPLRVNGIQPAFGIELGLDTPRSNEGHQDPYRQANASYSLVQREAGHVVRHTLIDVGMGVVASLLDFYEDRAFPDDPAHEPLSLERLEQELRRVSGSYDVRPALHGMVLGDGIPWPEQQTVSGREGHDDTRTGQVPRPS